MKQALARSLFLIVAYSVASVFILTIHRLSPTNMAGPGWDLVVYGLAAITGIGILAKNITGSWEKIVITGTRLINLLGSAAMLILTYYAWIN